MVEGIRQRGMGESVSVALAHAIDPPERATARERQGTRPDLEPFVKFMEGERDETHERMGQSGLCPYPQPGRGRFQHFQLKGYIDASPEEIVACRGK